ncbi:MAG TPA: hypothetical protein VE713_12235 [Pyrinomonadaceae bacterium]|jgi:hypothetical protein|nr:hypothetical protein [Pyrinomonadaceae bacterium]
MSVKTNYHLGRGALRVADRDASGNPGALEDVGEVMISVEISKDYKSNKSTRNAVSETDAHVPTDQEVKGTITLKETTAKNLERILHGTKTDYAGSSVVGAAFPSGVQAGETYELPGFTGIASALTIKDSAGGGGATVDPAKYSVDLNYGTVTFLDVTGFTQPFKASFTNAASTRSSILTRRVINKYLRFEGLNIGNNDGPRRFLDVLYNCTLLPAKKFDPKGDDYASYELDFVALADPNKSEDAELGRYGFHLALE